MVKKVILLVFVLLLIAGWLWWFWATASACRHDCLTKTFTIRKGEGLGSIAQRLEEEKVIKSSLAFQILVLEEGLRQKIQAGDFRLSTAMTPLEVARQLTHGTFDRRITLVEGWRREEIAEKLDKEFQGENSKFNNVEFLELTKNLEGELFPDTYLFPQDADAQKVVLVLTSNFRKKTERLKPDSRALTLASILEREAKHEVDRPIVAGILLKRLSAGWSLQADATVQYIVGTKNCESKKDQCDWWPSQLSKQDLEIKSPYNTYLSAGLPPAPISNPGLSAIEAALNPKETDYWYYLSDKNGDMHYATTLEEHQKNIEKYLPPS